MSWHRISKKKDLSPLTQRSVNRITNLLKRQFCIYEMEGDNWWSG